jgi:alpha-galactosidase
MHLQWQKQLCAIIIGILAAAFPSVFALNNGLALTPPMGWNSWNTFFCNVNEDLIKGMADAMAGSGMKDAGYEYIVVDDCWQTSRDSAGNIVADASKFPSGMKSLADYVHTKGLKFGLYTDIGTATCQGRPGSKDHEVLDANQYAAWGVDYTKVDWCNTSGQDMLSSYTVMKNALLACGRPIVFSICSWEYFTGAESIGNLWRTTTDISGSWSSVMSITNAQIGNEVHAGPGHWNDPDMLEVGNGDLTVGQDRAHFGLWCILAAPLITGNDLRSMTPEVLSILTNREVIAVDQDSLGRQGTRIRSDGLGHDTWMKVLRDGSRAVLLLNTGTSAVSMSVPLRGIGLIRSGTATVRDLWAHADLGQITDSITVTVQLGDAAMLRITPGPDLLAPSVRQVCTMADSARIGVLFSEPLDPASAVVAANYLFDHGITTASASILPDSQTVVVTLSAPLDGIATYAVSISNVRDPAGNVIAANTVFTFTSLRSVTKIRFYPRPAWEARMVGGVFEGTDGDKVDGTYRPFYTIGATPASRTWTEVTALDNTNGTFHHLRYRSPANGFCNVCEVEFWNGEVKLTGTPFGTPGSWGSAGSDYTKVFDGDVSTYFDCPLADDGYSGITVSGATPVWNAGFTQQKTERARSNGTMFDLSGRLIMHHVTIGKTKAFPGNANGVHVIKMSDGAIRKDIHQ